MGGEGAHEGEAGRDDADGEFDVDPDGGVDDRVCGGGCLLSRVVDNGIGNMGKGKCERQVIYRLYLRNLIAPRKAHGLYSQGPSYNESVIAEISDARSEATARNVQATKKEDEGDSDFLPPAHL